MFTKQGNMNGFTLLEVIASIIIISIVLLSFSQLFIQANKAATINNEKLVTINLADAMLAKLKSTSQSNKSFDTLEDYFIDSSQTDPKLKNPPLEIEMNGRIYTITYTPSQSTTKHKNSNYSEQDLHLIKVVVTVTAPDGKTKGTSEGYISYE